MRNFCFVLVELLSLVQCLLVLVCLAESLPADTKPVTSSLHQEESGIKGAAADEVDVKHHVKKKKREKKEVV